LSSSTNKSDPNELSFLDTFFGGQQSSSSQSIVSSLNLNSFNNSNKGSDMDYITKSLEEANKKSNDKPKSIFDGIEDKNKIQSSNNLFTSSQDNKFKLNKTSNNQQKTSDLAGFNFDFNNSSNKGSGSNIDSFNFNTGANKSANNNIIDSLLNDLPQVNNNNIYPQSNNNLFNAFGNSTSSQKKNIDLNDEYDLDFLKPSNSKNKSSSNYNFPNMGKNEQNSNGNNFDFGSFSNNYNQNAINNMNNLKFNNINSISNNLGEVFPNQQQNTIGNNFNMNKGNSNNANNNIFNFTNNFGNTSNDPNKKGLNNNTKSDNLFDGLLNM